LDALERVAQVPIIHLDHMLRPVPQVLKDNPRG
jgi:hypothetical protein